MYHPLGPLCETPRAGKTSFLGGGESHPPALPQMRYFCSLEDVEQESSLHGNVCQRVGAETIAVEGGGGVGKHVGGLPGLQKIFGDNGRI